MFKIIYNSRWSVPFILSLMAFALAAIVFFGARQDEVDKALALKNGPPAAVSLNAFDPKRDAHPMDEVTVTGWINTDYNYQLTLTTKTKRSSYDTVRRMFVLFGPEDTAETKTARAVVLLPNSDVDRFIDDVMANATGFAAGNPVFALNGTASKTADLDDMVVDALRKQGLTAAPNFRFIEIWPATGRAAALAPTPDQPLQLAAFPGVPGLLLFLIAIVKFTRRHRVAAVSQTRAHLAQMQAVAAKETSGAAPIFAAMPPNMPDPAPAVPKGVSWPFPRPSSTLFLMIAIGVLFFANVPGMWPLWFLGGLMSVIHFIARVKVAMDNGVAALASALGNTPAPETSKPETPKPEVARSASPVHATPALSDRLAGLLEMAKEKCLIKLAPLAAVLVLVFANGGLTPFLSGASKDPIGGPIVVVGPDMFEPVAAPALPDPVVAPSPKADALQPETPAEEAAAIPAAKPVTVAHQPANPLIPAAASLRPATPVPEVTPENLTDAPPVADAPPAADDPVAVSVATADASPAPEIVAPQTAGLAASAFGGLPMLMALAAFALLAAGAFAFKTMRASVPAKVLAGKDPWANLAREARG